MTKLQKWLSGLLAIQLLLAAGLLWDSYRDQQGSEPQALLAINAEQIDRIQISDGDNSVSLQQSGQQWLLPDDNLPATETKVSSTLDSLAAVSFVWPVSTSDSSHQRFEVEDDNFQRDVKLYSGDQLVAHLLVGTSPGFRKVHVRRAEDNAVYAVNLNSFDFPATAADWLDTALLTIDDANLISGADYTIKKVGDAWQFDLDANLGEDSAPAVNADKAQQLVTALGNFRVQDKADVVPSGEPVVLEVTSANEKKRLEFFQQDDKYYLRRDDRDMIFTINKYDFERLAEIRREDLQAVPAEPESAVEPEKAVELKPTETAIQ